MTNSADPDQKPTDLDLHCLPKRGISGFSRTTVKPPSSFPSDHSKAVPLLQIVFVCASMISYRAFVL